MAPPPSGKRANPRGWASATLEVALLSLFCCSTAARAENPTNSTAQPNTNSTTQPNTNTAAQPNKNTPSAADLEQRLAAQEARLRDQEALLRAQEARLRAQESRLQQQEARLRAAEQAQAAEHGRVAGPPAPTAPARDPLFGFGSEGFFLGGKDVFQVRLRGILQTDARAYFSTGATAIPDQFIIRRARPIVEGTVANLLDFRLVPDFAQGNALLYDAYVDIRILRSIALRVGKLKSPFGLERLQNDAFLPFAERGLPSNLVPDRDIGAVLHGDVAGGTFLYELGIFDGALDNNGANQDGDTNDGKDLVVRLFGHPLRVLRSAVVRDLGLGVAASWGKQHGTASLPGLGPYKTTGQNTFFAYLFDQTAIRPTVIAISNHYRFSPQLYWYVGPVGLVGEYVWDAITVSNSLAGAQPRVTLVQQAWQTELQLVVTGERPGYNGVTPHHPFNPWKLRFGALELVGRVGQLFIDPKSFPMFADPTKSASYALEWGAGFNWYLVSVFKIAVDFERTTFHGGGGNLTGDRRPENTLFARVQLSF